MVHIRLLCICLVVTFFPFLTLCNPLQLTSAAFSAVALSMGFVFKDTLYCHITECCSRKWVAYNNSAFELALSSRVYGQPLVYRLSSAINDHWNNRHPAKALAIALHGPTGTGKNYAVRILAEHLFKRGSRSRFFHFFSATVHFPHQHLLATYADQIHQWIRGNVSACPQSVFVFDEIDKMPESLLDTLKPFLDYHEHINGIDYRQSIFILLSNSGSDVIMRRMVELRRAGSSRQEVTDSAEFDHLLSAHVYSDNSSALKESSLLRHHLISRFIPFLPLERQHVIGCIRDYLTVSHPKWLDNAALLDKILQQLPFVPSEEKFFSSAGCKRIIDKTLMVLSEFE